MSYLLDTHALLWWLTDDTQLSVPARAAMANEANTIFVSAASAWEIATKARLGKLDSLPDATIRYNELIAADGFTPLPINPQHGMRAGSYPAPHRDPFDRLLAAQSEIEQLVLITRDPAFVHFNCRTLW